MAGRGQNPTGQRHNVGRQPAAVERPGREQESVVADRDHVSVGQRLLWPDDRQADLPLFGELDQPLEVAGGDIDVLRLQPEPSQPIGSVA